MLKWFKRRGQPAEPKLTDAQIVLLAAESMTLAHLSRADATTEKQHEEILQSWGITIHELENETDLLRYVWAILIINSAAIESLIDMIVVTQDNTANGILDGLDAPLGLKEQFHQALPDMREIVKFESLIQQATIYAMNLK